MTRILTTHTGSLARPPRLRELLFAADRGERVDAPEFDQVVRDAVRDCVRKQVDVGLDIVNDGEMGKVSFASYVRERLNGFSEHGEPLPASLDARAFPEWASRSPLPALRYACTAPVTWSNFDPVERDITNLHLAVDACEVEAAFLTAVSPGTLANFFPNRHYASRQSYLAALAETMHREYAAIVQAGFLLQVDCPDLALHDIWFPDLSVVQFREVVAENIAALNHALEGIATDRVRMHVCWGASERPLVRSIPLASIVDLLLKARVGWLSIVGANGRHAYEWRQWQRTRLPAGIRLVPGVIDNTTNIVEHPDVVAERLVRYASVVGKENVTAGVDCGFATGAGSTQVDERVAWAKLEALVAGARLASNELWANA